MQLHAEELKQKFHRLIWLSYEKSLGYSSVKVQTPKSEELKKVERNCKVV
jgi:hypothetical protein